jgi:hypothetical protein
VLVVEILEKAGDHPVEEDQKEPLAGRLFDDWTEDKKQSVSIVNNMDALGNFDAGKIQWAIDHAYQS